MARRKTTPTPSETPVTDYRHADKRKNIPPAGLAAQGKVAREPKQRYSYDPHLPPALRFDETGGADRLPELLETARQRALTADEARLLAGALRAHQPWLEWSGKRERAGFDVDPVALHIHERVAAQAIIKLAERQPLQRSLFADPELDYRQAVQFYRHDVDWANRLILGDSLVVMQSLARREDLAGKVQMIYVDPPYGIKFASNFQPLVGRRDVKDKAEDLTREPEQVKAYRDTWTLGVHSYLAYLRDRLIVARELLADSGSIFVQISMENIHRLRMVMDEIFGKDNLVTEIIFSKTSSATAEYLATVNDYLLWYAKDKVQLKFKFKPIFVQKPSPFDDPDTKYDQVELSDSTRRALKNDEQLGMVPLPTGAKPYRLSGIDSQTGTENTRFPVEFEGSTFAPSGTRGWSTSIEGMRRLIGAGRVQKSQTIINFVRFFEDHPYQKVTNVWADIGGAVQSRSDPKIYVVQTGTSVVQRCMLMTTDPGDLVLDPTCGSGTTAYVAEQWGRRWITIDTSRVAIALARQRLLTAKFDYYAIKDPSGLGDPKGLSPSSGLVYKTVPHVTLKSIAQNQALDPIFARWEPVLAEKLAALNAALAGVAPEVRTRLQAKLAAKERSEGKSALTDADRRRWLLPALRPHPSPLPEGEGGGWREWEVPFDADPDWPPALRAALEDYRRAWRAKMDEVNATIAASAPQETLVDQPQVVSGILRVSGPFTVEGVQPAEESLDMESPVGGEPEELPAFPPPQAGEGGVGAANAEAYLDKMVRLLRQDGVRFPDNKVLKFRRLEPLPNSILHAEGEWGNGGAPPPQPSPAGAGEGADLPSPSGRGTGGEGLRRVAVTFGPQYGPITAQQVEECLREAYRRGYDDLVFAGFTIDGAAQAVIQEDLNPKVRCHLAHISPDVAMGDLLKDTPGSQLFTVFGLPRVNLEQTKPGEWTVEMEGVDIYDPLSNTIRATDAGKVAAWFLDSDYDGRTFCITQAFFPDSSAWEKLARALKSVVDAERFAAFFGTRSLPFAAGEHGRIAVKVIDPRGNEVMRVMRLGEQAYI